MFLAVSGKVHDGRNGMSLPEKAALFFLPSAMPVVPVALFLPESYFFHNDVYTFLKIRDACMRMLWAGLPDAGQALRPGHAGLWSRYGKRIVTLA